MTDIETINQAATDTFPRSQGFEVSTTGIPDYRDGLLIVSRYESIVRHPNMKEPCKVTITAPGSSDLTSDVDSTIEIKGTENLPLSFIEAHGTRTGNFDLKRLDDIEAKLSAKMIAGYNEATVARHEKTSSAHRDSNVYFSGFMSADYPVSNDFPNHLHEKRLNEAAANLVTLRMSLAPAAWDEFVHQTTQSMPAEAKADFEKTVGRTQQFADYRQSKIDAMKQEFADVFADRPGQHDDMEVMVLNDLYAQHLEEVAVARGRYLDAVTPEAKAEAAVQVQHSQIQANLFAHEAYIGKSPVVHVVQGMQKGESANLSPDTIVGSIVHQIGFRLEHEGRAEDTAKYIFRVADLLFGQLAAPLTETQLDSLAANPSGLLPGLGDHGVRFTRDELALVNSEVKLFREIKKNPNFSPIQKREATRALLLERASQLGVKGETPEATLSLLATRERDLLSSIASRVMVAGSLRNENPG